ncbi:MAG TPA: hypothetical protein VGM84_18115 [Steroidobacteraceae bacterium]
MEPGSAADWAVAAFAGATAYFAFRGWKSSKQVEWLIGSLESHSTMRIRLDAKRENVKVIAYDPTVSRYPARIPLAGEEWPLDTIYLALPPDLRRSPE